MDSIAINAWFGGAVLLLAAIVSSIVTIVGLRGTAKEKNVKIVQDNYTTLEGNFTRANTRLTEENSRLSHANIRLETLLVETKSECERRINRLQEYVLTLTSKLPEPGATQSVIIAGIDTNALPALPVVMATPAPVVITGTEVTVPVAVKEPLPLPMTPAEVKAAVAEAAKAG